MPCHNIYVFSLNPCSKLLRVAGGREAVRTCGLEFGGGGGFVGGRLD